jgi:hypothetical protein
MLRDGRKRGGHGVKFGAAPPGLRSMHFETAPVPGTVFHRAMSGSGVAAEAGIVAPRFYLAGSMAGSQPVPVSSSAARSAMSVCLSAAILSAAALPLASVTASRMSGFHTRPR